MPSYSKLTCSHFFSRFFLVSLSLSPGRPRQALLGRDRARARVDRRLRRSVPRAHRARAAAASAAPARVSAAPSARVVGAAVLCVSDAVDRRAAAERVADSDGRRLFRLRFCFKRHAPSAPVEATVGRLCVGAATAAAPDAPTLSTGNGRSSLVSAHVLVFILHNLVCIIQQQSAAVPQRQRRVVGIVVGATVGARVAALTVARACIACTCRAARTRRALWIRGLLSAPFTQAGQ